MKQEHSAPLSIWAALGVERAERVERVVKAGRLPGSRLRPGGGGIMAGGERGVFGRR